MIWVRHLVAFLAGGGLLLAIGGFLLGAGGIRADVETLKAGAAEARQAVIDVATIKTSIKAIEKEQKQQREDAKERDGLLREILDRLPRS